MGAVPYYDATLLQLIRRFIRVTPTSTALPPALGVWSARDAWKCLAMVTVFQFVFGVMWSGFWRLVPHPASWSTSGAGYLLSAGLSYSLTLLTTLYFARTESFSAFRTAFGLDRPPSSYAWAAVALTLLIRWAGGLFISLGWSHGIHAADLWGFRHTVAPERYLFLAPSLVLAPLCEEIYMRGFLYRAFRGSYSVGLSTLLILIITAFYHWWEYKQSWQPVVTITTLTLLQCYLRERTGSLCDCILCHAVYNFTRLVGYFRLG